MVVEVMLVALVGMLGMMEWRFQRELCRAADEAEAFRVLAAEAETGRLTAEARATAAEDGLATLRSSVFQRNLAAAEAEQQHMDTIATMQAEYSLVVGLLDATTRRLMAATLDLRPSPPVALSAAAAAPLQTQAASGPGLRQDGTRLTLAREQT